MIIVDDPSNTFTPGETYAPADIYAWLDNDMLPNGLVVQDQQLLVVSQGELRPCNSDGKPLIGNDSLHATTPIALQVLEETHAILEAGLIPTYQAIADRIGRTRGAVGYHLRRLERHGLIERGGNGSHGETHLTALGYNVVTGKNNAARARTLPTRYRILLTLHNHPAYTLTRRNVSNIIGVTPSVIENHYPQLEQEELIYRRPSKHPANARITEKGCAKLRELNLID
jgi:DNA-binding MarR family transcriptional regulator